MHRSSWIWISLLLVLVACQHQSPLKPIRPTATPGGEIIGQPLQVTFSELEEDPHAFLNQRIQVTGSYTHLAVAACRYERGPGARWSLIADNLRMDVIGFESILRLAPDGTPLTIEGIWRRYEGALGCGKNAPAGIAWYLEVDRIVQPNPLPHFSGLPGSIDPPTISPPQPPELITPTVTPDSAGTATPTLTASPTTTPAPSTTPTQPGLTTTILPSLNTPTPTATGTAVATPTSLPPPPPGSTATSTPVPLPTLGGTPTPSATPTSSGYPGPPPPPTGYP